MMTQAPTKPQLLAHHGENEVVVLLRQVQELLAAAAEAHAQQAAGADGDEALCQLIAVAGVVQPRVVPHGDAGRAVLDDAAFRQLDNRKPMAPTPPIPAATSQP